MRNNILRTIGSLSLVAGLLLGLLVGVQTFMTRGPSLEAQVSGYFIAVGYAWAGITTWALLSAVVDIAKKLGIRS